MRDERQARFQHQAGAYGISGRFYWPIQGIIDVRPSVDLPPTGGFAKSEHQDFNFEELVGFRRAYTEVSGSPNDEPVEGKTRKAHNNLSLTVVKDFNLLHVVEVEKIVSRITTRYFEDDREIEIVLSGTRFEGFRIFGREVKVKLATDLFYKNPRFSKLRESYAEQLFKDRFHKLTGGRPLPGEECPCPDIQTTLVEDIVVPDPTPEFEVRGNVIEIFHVGRLFLGELNISPTRKALNMIRWELGCPTGGDGTIGGGQGGGNIIPF